MSTIDLAGPSGDSRLLLMRHPETVANAEGRYLGDSEAPLSDTGLEQRARAVSALHAFGPDRVVTSPLSRCAELASLVAQPLGIDRHVDGRIREIGFGVLEGLTYAEAKERGIAFMWDDPEATRPAPGGEPFVEFDARIADARISLMTHPGTTAVIAHGGVIRHLLMGWFKIPYELMWNLRVENVSTAVVGIVDGTPVLEKFGLTPEDLGRLRG